METRANYILIGAFTLAGILGAFAFLLWLAKVDVDRQYAYYDILFDNVSGLGAAGDVRYNGLPVGQVVELELDDADPSKVRVRIEVGADTPIKTDTIAKLQAQGVTGVSFVALSGGSPEADPLPRGGVIDSELSALQTIFEGAPELLEKAIKLLDDINKVVSDENREAVTTLLDNLATSSGRLDNVLTDFEGLSDDLGLAAREIAGFTGRLEELADTAEVTLETATDALTTAKGTMERAEGAVDATVETLDTAKTTFATADELMKGDLKTLVQNGASAAEALETTVKTLEPSALATLEAAQDLAQNRLPSLVEDIRTATANLESQVTSVGTDASELIARYDEVGTTLQARLQEAESAIASFETASTEATATLESVRRTSDNANDFIETQGRPLAQEAAATLSSARTLADERLPQLIDQANTTLQTVDREAQAISTEGREAIALATARLTEARATIERLDGVLVSTDQAMVSVQTAADEFFELTEGEGALLVADARAAAADAREAIATINLTVQEDLPGLMEDVRGAAQTANRVIDEVGTDVSTVAERLTKLSDEGSTALTAATDTFANANETLAAITSAMDSAEGTLGSAEKAFDSVNRVIDEDLDAMVADVREAVTAFTSTVEKVSEDVDAISGEILEASSSASNLLGTVDGIVQENRRQVSEFLRVGLPQFQRFTEESRMLVVNLERLVARIERDPARFLLGTQASDFRR